MPRFRAIAEFIDAATGRRVYPGEIAELVDERQIERLRRAGCIAAPETSAAVENYETTGIADTTETISADETAESAVSKHKRNYSRNRGG